MWTPDLRQRIIKEVELITPHMLINTWQELEYRLDICRATTTAHSEVCRRAYKYFWVTLYTVENINFIKLLGTVLKHKNVFLYTSSPDTLYFTY
jgi:hypothetical protein